jgi:hypothetical protein
MKYRALDHGCPKNSRRIAVAEKNSHIGKYIFLDCFASGFQPAEFSLTLPDMEKPKEEIQ